MPFIPINLNEIPESRPVPNGKYDLTITAAEYEMSKSKGKPQYRCSIGVDGHDNAPNVTHWVSIPAEDDEPKSAQFKGLLLHRFLELFSIQVDPKGFDTEKLVMELIGAKASGELVIDETGEYNRLVVPKLKAEPVAGGRGAPKPPKR